MSSVGYHEPVEGLSDATRDMHRAIVSLIEEPEAIDWYNQRAAACNDGELKAILSTIETRRRNMGLWCSNGFHAQILRSRRN